MPYQVSAIIPVYNGVRHIRRSIESVLRQTRPVTELLVIDDGSTDETCEVVRSYGPPVRLITQQNSGAGAARNHGAREATSEWLAFLDHDDEWLPNKLELQLSALENLPGATLCYGPFWLFGLKGSVSRVFIPLGEVRKRSRIGNPFPPSVVVVRRAEFLELGGFREGLRTSCEDWEFFARFVGRFRVTAISETILNYYETPASNSLKDHAGMLRNSLTIVDGSLLEGTSGITRSIWRRRIRASMYKQAAITAWLSGGPAAGYLFRSLREWPMPVPGVPRHRMLYRMIHRAIKFRRGAEAVRSE